MLILIIAIVAVIGIVWLQFKCFNSTKKGIEELKTFFPPIDKVALKECTTNKDAITYYHCWWFKGIQGSRI